MDLFAKVEGQSIALSVPDIWQRLRARRRVILEKVDLFHPNRMIPFIQKDSTLIIKGVRQGHLLTELNGEEYLFQSAKRNLVSLSEKELIDLAFAASDIQFVFD